jgi:hypothetical protein
MAKPSSQTGRRGGLVVGGVLSSITGRTPIAPARKCHSPPLCPDGGAMFDRGRRQRSAVPEGAIRTRCEACRRIRDGFSAAIVTVTGEFTPAQVVQIKALARHQEKAEMAEHPLNRIMAIERPNGVDHDHYDHRSSFASPVSPERSKKPRGPPRRTL